jgi:hypothetical protein
MRHEEQRRAAVDELPDAAHALVLERGIATASGLVHDQDVGFHVRLHCDTRGRTTMPLE